MTKNELMSLNIGDTVRDLEGNEGKVVGFTRHEDDTWESSEIYADNEDMSFFPEDLTIIHRK